jgi:hypothetical protein
MIELAVAGIIGAVLFRVRGGMFAIGWGTQGGRGAWAIGMTLLCGYLAGWTDWRLALLAPALFIGTVPGWWMSLGLGRTAVTARWIDWYAWLRDVQVMAARGLWFTIPALPVLWWTGHDWWPALVGILCPICYQIGWILPFRHRGPVWGEVLFGAVLGAAFAAGIAS